MSSLFDSKFAFFFTGLALLEIVLLVFWVKFYFVSGIKIFSYSLKYNKASEYFNIYAFDQVSNDDRWKPDIIFKLIDNSTIAFREKYQVFISISNIKYVTPFIRGVIIFDPENKLIRVSGFAYYYVVLFIGLYYWIIIEKLHYINIAANNLILIFVLFILPIIITGISYFIWRNKINKVIKYLKTCFE